VEIEPQWTARRPERMGVVPIMGGIPPCRAGGPALETGFFATSFVQLWVPRSRAFGEGGHDAADPIGFLTSPPPDTAPSAS